MSDPLRAILNTTVFYISSLFVKERPVGLLYADRSDNNPIDKQGFIQFKSLA